ncbi:hypothetical protein Cni_G20397 [Canna indica]|uniref:N-acetyltransferase domain-containing protein n=1 Tax=Canna indica TaxID=4628 RepID=A0AAQ3KR80_9LILI|nr:hypothetical protein Cni_G20397 [Canna indica]
MEAAAAEGGLGGEEAAAFSPSEIEYVSYGGEHHLPLIMGLVDQELSEPYSIFTYRYFVYLWPNLTFLAFHREKCVGTVVCKLGEHRNTYRGYIAMLVVVKPYRGRGIATELVTRSIRVMMESGCDEVTLEAEVTNKGALALYGRLGFIRAKRLFRHARIALPQSLHSGRTSFHSPSLPSPLHPGGQRRSTSRQAAEIHIPEVPLAASAPSSFAKLPPPLPHPIFRGLPALELQSDLILGACFSTLPPHLHNSMASSVLLCIVPHVFLIFISTTPQIDRRMASALAQSYILPAIVFNRSRKPFCGSRSRALKKLFYLQMQFRGLQSFMAVQNADLIFLSKPLWDFHSAVSGYVSDPQEISCIVAMFDLFTAKTIKVIMLAQDEARRLGHAFLGTEQILLPLMCQGANNITENDLRSVGVSPKVAHVQSVAGSRSECVADIPFSPRAKHVFPT